MNELNERFLQVRKSLRLSQTAFGEKINMTRSEVKNIEYNLTTLKEKSIPVLCSVYNVNENWLRTGEGEMFKDFDRNKHIIDMLTEALEVNDDPTPAQAFKKKLIEAIADLSPEAWEKLADIAEELKKGQKKEQA